MAKISAVINTLNDEDKIGKCLSSIKWVDEVILVDLGSTDKTKEIARDYGTKIFDHPKVDYVELVRNYSIEKATGEWILLIDPDEEVPTRLKDELLKIAQENEIDAVAIPRKNFIFGKFISHSAWWPDYKIRFFKKGKVTWGGEIHVDGKAQGKVLNLPANPNSSIIHHPYPDLTSFLERANRYTTIEAEEKFRKGTKFSILGMSLSILREFIKRFIKGKGFLDGMHGVVLTILMMYYQFLVWGKLWERGRKQ